MEPAGIEINVPPVASNVPCFFFVGLVVVVAGRSHRVLIELPF